jgi:hypothetical protein
MFGRSHPWSYQILEFLWWETFIAGSVFLIIIGLFQFYVFLWFRPGRLFACGWEFPIDSRLFSLLAYNFHSGLLHPLYFWGISCNICFLFFIFFVYKEKYLFQKEHSGGPIFCLKSCLNTYVIMSQSLVNTNLKISVWAHLGTDGSRLYLRC